MIIPPDSPPAYPRSAALRLLDYSIGSGSDREITRAGCRRRLTPSIVVDPISAKDRASLQTTTATKLQPTAPRASTASERSVRGD